MDDAVRLAVLHAGRIFYRPERALAQVVDHFAGFSDTDFPGADAVARHAYQQPIRLAATWAVFGLKPLHWPMLNLLDAAERERRAYAAAAAAAVTAARRKPA